jgi:hypothetical protein
VGCNSRWARITCRLLGKAIIEMMLSHLVM